MVPSPCLHPVWVFNESLGRKIKVPCGHCSACLVSKGYSRKERVNDQFLRYHYRFFVTLTYAPEFLPIAKYDELTDSLLHPTDVDYLGVVKSVPISKVSEWKNLEFLKTRIDKYGGLPVLSHRHLIQFKKRLRENLKSKLGKYEVLYIYACGEYGPTGDNFRPHYHLLLGTDSERVASVLRECIYQAWSVLHQGAKAVDYTQFGFIDFQECYDCGGSNYCAQYLACNTNLPFVLSKSVFRPFSSSSRKTIDYECQRDSCEVERIYRDLPSTVTRIRVQSGEVLTTPIGYCDYSKTFPRFIGLVRLPVDVRIRIFEFVKRFPASKSCKQLANEWYDIYRFRQQLEKYRYNIFDNIAFSVSIDIDNVLVQLYVDPLNADKTINGLTNCFQVNRRIAKVINLLGVSSREYFERQDAYFSKLELAKLKRFYDSVNEEMVSVLHPLSLQDVFELYYNTEEKSCDIGYYQRQFGVAAASRSVFDLILQHNYKVKVDTILLNNTKTKKRNSDFESKGLKKRDWVPILSHKKSLITKLF